MTLRFRSSYREQTPARLTAVQTSDFAWVTTIHEKQPGREGFVMTSPARCALCATLSLLVLAVACPKSTVEAAEPTVKPLLLPRFASLKPSRANLRSGPGTEYPTVWVYHREGLPLEIIKEFEGWRQVRDADGASGWVLQSFLSARRTALIEPWELKTAAGKTGVPPPQVALLSDDNDKAGVVVKVEAGVIANVLTCDGAWCWVTVEKFKGYIQQKKLWGVYDKEVLK